MEPFGGMEETGRRRGWRWREDSFLIVYGEARDSMRRVNEPLTMLPPKEDHPYLISRLPSFFAAA